MIHPLGNLSLSSSHRVSQISIHATQPYLAVQSHDRSVEIFRIRTEEEIQKKRSRRKKREKEKGKKLTEHNTEIDSEIKLVDLFTPHAIVRASGKVRSFAMSGTQVFEPWRVSPYDPYSTALCSTYLQRFGSV